MPESYENTPNKINETWNKVNENTIRKNKLTKVQVAPRTIYYSKKITEYIIEEDYDFLSNGNYLPLNIFLGNFPTNFLPFIRLMVIYNTSAAY